MHKPNIRAALIQCAGCRMLDVWPQDGRPYRCHRCGSTCHPFRPPHHPAAVYVLAAVWALILWGLIGGMLWITIH